MTDDQYDEYQEPQWPVCERCSNPSTGYVGTDGVGWLCRSCQSKFANADNWSFIDGWEEPDDD